MQRGHFELQRHKVLLQSYHCPQKNIEFQKEIDRLYSQVEENVIDFE